MYKILKSILYIYIYVCVFFIKKKVGGLSHSIFPSTCFVVGQTRRVKVGWWRKPQPNPQNELAKMGWPKESNLFGYSYFSIFFVFLCIKIIVK